MTDAPLVLSFRDGVSVVERGDGLTLRTSAGEQTLTQLSPGLRRAFVALADGGDTEGALVELVRATDGPSAVAPLHYYLERFRALRLIAYSVLAQTERLVTVVPMTALFRPRPELPSAHTRVRLSRFAYWRRDGDVLVVESPLSSVRTIVWRQTGVAVLSQLVQPRAAVELSRVVRSLDVHTAQSALGLLLDAQLVAEVDPDGSLPEDSDDASGWEFHDLLFHRRSRRGYHDQPCGADESGHETAKPPSPVRHRPPDGGIELRRPDLDGLTRDDIPLTRVVEGRASVRRYGSTPIALDELAEFLYRTARVREIIDPHAGRAPQFVRTGRPYPAAGGMYELELYVSVNRCSNLARGIYHYDPVHHRLHQVAGPDGAFAALMADVRTAGALQGEPQILITLTSRFRRLSWRYRGIAYALTLKNVGILLQNMYLVATAMNLAPCAVGTADSATFARAVANRDLAESAVGEFLLGSLPQGDRRGADSRTDF